MRPAQPGDAALTGAGVVTTLGFGVEACFAALAAGHTGVRQTDDAPSSTARGWAARVEEPRLRTPVPSALESQLKFLNGAGELAVQAATEAVHGAGLAAAGHEPERSGLYLAQIESRDWDCAEFRAALAEATDSFTQPLRHAALNRSATRRVKPFFLLENLKNNAFSFLATMFDLRGANTSVSGFAGLVVPVLDLVARGLAHHRLDVAVVVAAARVTGAMSRVELEAQGITRLGPAGRAPGEGAGALVLERLDAAAHRGAPVLAVLLGRDVVTAPAGEHRWAPTAAVLARAAREALAQAEIEPGDLLGVVAPGVGEEGLDEVLASLPATAATPRVAWKSQTGDLALASDAVELALAARALGAAHLPGLPSAEGGRAVLVLSAGLLGQAGAVVLGRGPGSPNGVAGRPRR